MEERVPLTIVIPFHQPSPYLPSLYAEFRRQMPDAEVWLVADGPAATVPVSTEELPVLHLPQLRGPSAARNAALSRARGTHIYFFDSDDLPIPGALRELWKLRRNDAAIFGTIAGFVDDTTGWKEEGPAGFGLPARGICSLSDLRKGLEFHPSPGRFLFPTASLREVGGFDESLSFAEDWELCLRLCSQGPLYGYSIPLFWYRFTGKNSCLRHENHRYTGLAKARAQAELLRRGYGIL